MYEQPESVISGTAMAMTGAMLLGMGRARYATMLFPLLAGDTGRQRAAADGWDRLSTALSEHPGLVDSAVKNVSWTAPSAELYQQTVVSYADDAGQKAASPRASADVLRTTADVYDVLGKAVLVTGASILTAGGIYRIASLNPYTRAVAEVAATAFGRRADQQAARLAQGARTAVSGGQGVLGKVVSKLASMSTTKKVIGGGVLGVTGGMMGQSAVAGEFSGTRLEAPAPGVKA